MTRKRFAIVNTGSVDSFAYTPPDQAYSAARILVKPNLTSRPEAPAAVSAAVLGAVLRGLRRAAPAGRIVIIDASHGDQSAADLFEDFGIQALLDQEMRLGDVSQMVMDSYPSADGLITAPEAVGDYDCVISVAALSTTPHVSGSLHNLIGLLPTSAHPDPNIWTTPSGLKRLSQAFASHLDGAVVEVDGRVVWGADLLAVDEAACRLAGVGMYEVATAEK